MILKFVYIGCSIIAILIVLSLYANMRDLIKQNNLLKQERDIYQESISHLRNHISNYCELADKAQEIPCEVAVYLHRFLSNRVKQLANQLCEPKLRPIRIEKKAIEYKLLSETLDAFAPLILEIEQKNVWNEVLSDKKVSV